MKSHGFPGKPEAKARGWRGERRASFRKRALSALCSLQMGGREVAHLRFQWEAIHIVSSPGIGTAEGTIQRVGQKAGGRGFWRSEISVGNRIYQWSLGLGQWGFCLFEPWHQGPIGAVRTPAGRAGGLPRLFALQPTDLCWSLSKQYLCIRSVLHVITF